MDRVRDHERELIGYALERLREVPGSDASTVPTDPDAPRAASISFTLGDIHPHDVAAILDEENVAVRAGHHCCQPLMERLGRGRHDARQLLRLQHAERRRPPGRRPAQGERDLRISVASAVSHGERAIERRCRS